MKIGINQLGKMHDSERHRKKPSEGLLELVNPLSLIALKNIEHGF